MSTPSNRTRRTSLFALAVAIALGGCASQRGADQQQLRLARAADASYRAADYAVARQRYAALLRSNPAYIPAALRLGALAYREGNLAEAERQFRGVLEQDPKSAPAKYNLAIVRVAQANRLLNEYLLLAPAAPNREYIGRLLATLEDIGQ